MKQNIRSAFCLLLLLVGSGCASLTQGSMQATEPPTPEGRGLCKYVGIGPVYCVRVEWDDGRQYDCMHTNTGGMWCTPVQETPGAEE